MRVLIIIVLALLTGGEAFSQPVHYTLRNYRAVDGLPQSQVRAMREDKNGYLWVGTEGGGLARFDGHSFRVYTTLDGLQSNIVNYFSHDDHGNLWIVHPRGITKFDGSSFKRFQQPGSPQDAVALRRMFNHGDTLFFMSAPGYVGKIFRDSVYYWSKPILQPDKDGKSPLIAFVREGPSKELLFCLDNGTFLCRRGKESFTIPFENGLGPRDVSSTFIYKNAFWLQTSRGFRRLDFQRRTIERDSLPVVNTILSYDSAKNVFWTWHGNDFLKEGLRKNEWKVDTVLHDIDIVTVMADAEGNSWFGSNGNGLYKYFVQDFDRCASERITSVMAIHHDREGSTWVGTATKGLFRIKKGKTKAFVSDDANRMNGIYTIAETPDGEIYVGGVDGLAKFNKEKDQLEWEEPDDLKKRRRIFNIQLTPENGMWMCKPMEGLLYRDEKRERLFTTADGLRANSCMAIYYSPRYKALFFGDEFGLGQIRNDSVKLLNNGAPNTSIIAIHPYRDSLLLLSTGGSGVVIYDPLTERRRSITTQDGLPSDFIYFTAPDENNDLWVGSEKGITRIRLDSQLNIREHLHFDYENGLTGVETNQNAFCFFDGNKIFGLIDGLYVYNDPPAQKTEFFPLHLTSVQLFYNERAAAEYSAGAEGFFNIPVGLSLPPDQNHITFKFNRVDKRSRKSIKFKYLLQGFDKTWSQPSYSSEVTYSNLPPGEYSFLVQSSDAKGGWSVRPLRYDFEIKLPFYARSWFIVSMIILGAFVIGLVLFLRVRQRVRHVVMLQKIRIKEQETVRKDIARDFHDEMGNQLSRIINYVSLLKLNGTNGNSHNQHLYAKVEESAKYLYTGTRDFIWSIDPGNDELSKLFLHIRDFGEKLFEEKKIKFRAINLVKEQIRLPYGFSREANLIFKEAMTNAFKYSNAENVTLSLKPVQEGFHLCLEDDGVGFSTSGDMKDGGLKNIRERAERLEASLTIESEPGKGTRVYIQFTTKTKKVQYGLTI
jgi:signal transduction histidine kinase/ligand-binding sensor domain-containing protein